MQRDTALKQGEIEKKGQDLHQIGVKQILKQKNGVCTVYTRPGGIITFGGRLVHFTGKSEGQRRGPIFEERGPKEMRERRGENGHEKYIPEFPQFVQSSASPGHLIQRCIAHLILLRQ